MPDVRPIPLFSEVAVAEDADATVSEGCHRQNVTYFTELKEWCATVEKEVQDWIGAFQEEDRRRNAEAAG